MAKTDRQKRTEKIGRRYVGAEVDLSDIGILEALATANERSVSAELRVAIKAHLENNAHQLAE